jgi:hypothetical protein
MSTTLGITRERRTEPHPFDPEITVLIPENDVLVWHLLVTNPAMAQVETKWESLK